MRAQAVVLHLLDSDHDTFITRPELMELHLLARHFAKSERLPAPTSLPELLDVIYLGFDRSVLASQLSLKEAAKDALATISKALQVGAS